MNSSAFLAIASAALFVLVFQGGVAADVGLQDILRSKRNMQTDASSDMKWLEYNTTRLIGGKISCVPTLTRRDYVIVPDVGAYKIHTRRTTWFDARETCVGEGGFHDLFVEGTWVTVTGESMHYIDYDPWSENQPNDTGDQDCAVLFDTGMSDYKCTNPAGFICEINLCEALGHRVHNLRSEPESEDSGGCC